MLEGDCLRVVSALNSKDCCNTLYGNVVKETRHQACKFHFCRFTRVRRVGTSWPTSSLEEQFHLLI